MSLESFGAGSGVVGGKAVEASAVRSRSHLSFAELDVLTSSQRIKKICDTYLFHPRPLLINATDKRQKIAPMTVAPVLTFPPSVAVEPIHAEIRSTALQRYLQDYLRAPSLTLLQALLGPAQAQVQQQYLQEEYDLQKKILDKQLMLSIRGRRARVLQRYLQYRLQAGNILFYTTVRDNPVLREHFRERGISNLGKKSFEVAFQGVLLTRDVEVMKALELSAMPEQNVSFFSPGITVIHASTEYGYVVNSVAADSYSAEAREILIALRTLEAKVASAYEQDFVRFNFIGHSAQTDKEIKNLQAFLQTYKATLLAAQAEAKIIFDRWASEVMEDVRVDACTADLRSFLNLYDTASICAHHPDKTPLFFHVYEPRYTHFAWDSAHGDEWMRAKLFERALRNCKESEYPGLDALRERYATACRKAGILPPDERCSHGDVIISSEEAMALSSIFFAEEKFFQQTVFAQEYYLYCEVIALVIFYTQKIKSPAPFIAVESELHDLFASEEAVIEENASLQAAQRLGAHDFFWQHTMEEAWQKTVIQQPIPLTTIFADQVVWLLSEERKWGEEYRVHQEKIAALQQKYRAWYLQTKTEHARCVTENLVAVRRYLTAAGMPTAEYLSAQELSAALSPISVSDPAYHPFFQAWVATALRGLGGLPTLLSVAHKMSKIERHALKQNRKHFLNLLELALSYGLRIGEMRSRILYPVAEFMLPGCQSFDVARCLFKWMSMLSPSLAAYREAILQYIDESEKELIPATENVGELIVGIFNRATYRRITCDPRHKRERAIVIVTLGAWLFNTTDPQIALAIITNCLRAYATMNPETGVFHRNRLTTMFKTCFGMTLENCAQVAKLTLLDRTETPAAGAGSGSDHREERGGRTEVIARHAVSFLSHNLTQLRRAAPVVLARSVEERVGERQSLLGKHLEMRVAPPPSYGATGSIQGPKNLV